MGVIVGGNTSSAACSVRRSWWLAAALISLSVACAYFACPVQAARVHALLTSETLPEPAFEAPTWVAVDQTTHHYYVTAATDPAHGQSMVYQYDEHGALDASRPILPPPTSQFAPNHVAVDNSGGPTNGYVYVQGGVKAVESDGEGLIQQYDASGSLTSVRISAAALPPTGTPQEGGLPPVVKPEIFTPLAIAVGPSGDVFAAENFKPGSSQTIEVFGPDGTFLRQLAPELIGAINGIAVDAAGQIFLATSFGSSETEQGNGLVEIDPSGRCVQSGCAPIDPHRIKGVAVDDAEGAVLTTGIVSEASREGRFSEYDIATGNLLGMTRLPQSHEPQGIGVDETSGEVVLADIGGAGEENTVKVFGGVEVVPDVVTGPPAAVTDHSVTLSGEIGAAGVPGATCVFQYVDAEGFAAHGFAGAAETPCSPEGPFSGATLEAVGAEVSGLRGGTVYHERLLGTNVNGSNPGEDVTFQTKGPSVTGEQATAITETGATLTGSINPRGGSTTYRFEYVTEAQFEEAGFAGALEVPAGRETIGPGNTAVPIAQRIEGLVPGNPYIFRIVAESIGGANAGVTEAPERGFAAFRPAVGLPDGRRYEQASPTEKNGADIEGEANAVAVSPEGDRVTFYSSAGIPGGNGAQWFPSYLASRGPGETGWSTQGILPPASSGPRGRVIGWTEDLSEVFDFATQPTGPAQLLARSSADGSLTVIGTEPGAPTATNFAFAGESTGGRFQIFESGSGEMVPGDRSGTQNVYLYDHESGELVVAGLLNDGTVPTDGAIAGPYDWYKSGSTEEPGGALESYYTEAAHVISSNGERIFFTAAGTGQLYVRENPLEPQSAMSGGACTEPSKACTIRISAPEGGVTDPETPAAFLGASKDGRIVYFLDSGRLTSDATGGNGFDLYRYDVDTGELTDVAVDSADKQGARAEGMLGMSDDGSRAYFVARGALTPDSTEAPGGETNLYFLEGDQLEFITRLGTGDSAGQEGVNWIPRSRTSGNSLVTKASRVTRDGRGLLFTSSRQLTGFANDRSAELYLSRAGQEISCISCNPTGEAPLGPASLQALPEKEFSAKLPFAILPHNVSANGNRIVFDTADALVASDHNAVNDVYEWEEPNPAEPADSCTAGSPAFVASSGGCLYLISGGAQGGEPSYFAGADEKGEDIFFFTRQSLVAQDRDNLVDVYDARIGGGIPDQEQVPTPPCEGEAGCLGATNPPPSATAPGTTGFQGPGNLKPKSCKKGFVRRHGKCVKKPKPKPHHKTRDTGHGKKKSAKGKKKQKKHGNSNGRAPR
jgi:hypothetical protein